MKHILLWICLISAMTVNSQTANYQYTKDQHQKEIIGYFTNWDAWKGTTHGVPDGFFNQLNIDYSQYTILNWSFFGVAYDGSLHSGDFRNQSIHLTGEIQQPAPLFNTDTYSSWDLYLRDGELEILQYLPDDLDIQPTNTLFWAYEDYGYKGNGTGWVHIDGTTGDYPLPLPKPNGKMGLIGLAHANNVKVMASIGGWSMSKHFPEMAADPVKRARFIQDCVTLINDYNFDGIDIDWEFPGEFSGMNFTGSTADYANFATLMSEIRAAIGPNKLISAAFNADPVKLAGFNWSALDASMDFYNMMTYDMHGGWSDQAGHNSPLYPYTNQETNGISWDNTFQYLNNQGVAPNKINMGVGFYGRGVITDGAASLNAPTVKVSKTISPDGLVQTAADYTNWSAYDGTPNYDYIRNNMTDWTYHWDNEAKVPYLTKDNYFLSYDNEASIAEKANYVDSNALGGVIVWQVFGDLDPGTVTATYSNKLPHAPSTTAPLVNKINEVFSGNSIPVNTAPVITFISPSQDTTISQDTFSLVPVSLKIDDLDGSIVHRMISVNGQSISFTQTGNIYSVDLLPSQYGVYEFTVAATDNDSNTTIDSLSIYITNDTLNSSIISHVITDSLWNEFFPHRFGVGTNTAGTGDFYSYTNFIEAMNRMANISILFERRCGTNLYKITRTDKSTLQTLVIREDANYASSSASIISKVVDYGTFGTDGTLENQQREIMAFLANISQETTGGWATAPGGQYAYGLYFNEESGYSGTSTIGYVDAGSTLYPPTSGKSYHGRGPIQLSWNTNYGQVSSFLFGDKTILLDHPEQVIQDGATAFQTAIWFWMTPQYPKPSAHDVMVENWQPSTTQIADGILAGFGATVNIINPAIECNSGTESSKVVGRIAHFERYTDIIGIGMALDGSDDPLELGCANMSPFQTDVNECNSITSIAFNSPNDGDSIAITIGDTIPVSLVIADPNNSLSNIQISINGTSYAGTTLHWTPTSLGNISLVASALENGVAITQTIHVTLFDAATATGCEGINNWTAIDIYSTPGQQVVYANTVYENKWWTQSETPGSHSVWDFVHTCDTDTSLSNMAPIIDSIAPENNVSISQSNFTALNLTFTAIDPDGSIQSALATINGTTVTLSQIGNTYSGTYLPASYGIQTITVSVTDNNSTTTTQQSTFSVTAPITNQSPIISAVIPVDATVISQSSFTSIPVSFSITDPDGTLITVSATINGNSVTLGSVGNQYTTSFTPSNAGIQTLLISATDNENATATAQAIFTVNIATNSCGVDGWQAQVYATPYTQVTLNNSIYENQWYAEAHEVPGVDNVWSFISYCSGGPDLTASCGYEIWDSSAIYATAGTPVFYNNKIYQNKWWVTNEIPSTLVAWEYVQDCNASNLQSNQQQIGSQNHTASSAQQTFAPAAAQNASRTRSETDSQDLIIHTSLAPNPATDRIGIITNGTISQISFINMFGEEKLNSRSTSIDISTLEKGIQFARILYENGQIEIIRFIKN